MSVAAQSGQASRRPTNSDGSVICKVELPDIQGGNSAYGGTRTVKEGYYFTSDQQIGEGTYGQVFMGTEKVTGAKVALKKIRMDTEKEGFPITAIREIKILSELEHENVVNLREIVRSEITKNNNYKGSIFMVFDYADFDLTGLMETQKFRFTEGQIKCLLKQILKGLAYCHMNGVLHRDLKASNILIDSKGIVKLADFGLARTYQDTQDGRLTNRVITLWYRPPELLLGLDKYGPEIDMWSVGCIFAELLTSKPIFPGKSESDQLDRIFQLLGSPSDQNWQGWSRLAASAREGRHDNLIGMVVPGKYRVNQLRKWVIDTAKNNNMQAPTDLALRLLEKMLCLDPAQRISAKDAFADNFFWTGTPTCQPHELPVDPKNSSHEFTMKRRRNEAAAHGGLHQEANKRRAPYNAPQANPYPSNSRFQAPPHNSGPNAPYMAPGAGYGGPGPRQPAYAPRNAPQPPAPYPAPLGVPPQPFPAAAGGAAPAPWHPGQQAAHMPGAQTSGQQPPPSSNYSSGTTYDGRGAYLPRGQQGSYQSRR